MQEDPQQCRTMRELAQRAGVSLNTVSLALKNHPSISSRVREQIQKLAVETGYRPDTVVSSLMAQLRTARKQRFLETIAFLSMHTAKKEWGNNIHYYHQGAALRADELGYRLEVFICGNSGAMQRKVSRILTARGIRGIVLPPLPNPMGHVSLDWQHFAVTRIGYSIAQPDVHRAVHDHYGGMVLAMRKLRKLGYRRPGFCTLKMQDQRVAHQWLAAYLMYSHVTGRGKEAFPPLLLQQWDRAKLRSWIDRYRPDVILSNMSQVADQLRELSIAIPGEIGFVNLDLHPYHGDMAGVDQRPPEVGAAAVDIVASRLLHNQLGIPSNPRTTLLNGYWTPGATVRTPPVV